MCELRGADDLALEFHGDLDNTKGGWDTAGRHSVGECCESDGLDRYADAEAALFKWDCSVGAKLR